MDELPRGTVTFLATDIQGSTEMWERYPDAMPRALERHKHLLREAGRDPPANADAVAEIVRQLDGLPLAIELAAARLKLFPPRVMVGRLAQRFDFLKGSLRDLRLRRCASARTA